MIILVPSIVNFILDQKIPGHIDLNLVRPKGQRSAVRADQVPRTFVASTSTIEFTVLSTWYFATD